MSYTITRGFRIRCNLCERWAHFFVDAAEMEQAYKRHEKDMHRCLVCRKLFARMMEGRPRKFCSTQCNNLFHARAGRVEGTMQHIREQEQVRRTITQALRAGQHVRNAVAAQFPEKSPLAVSRLINRVRSLPYKRRRESHGRHERQRLMPM